MNFTTNENLYKWNKVDPKIDTITEMANNADKIDTKFGGIDAQLADIVHNVSYLNIQGDGTDETTKIQNLFDSVPDGSVIRFPKTSQFYGLSSGLQLNSRKNLALIGEGEIKFLDGTIDSVYNNYPDYAIDSIFRIKDCENIIIKGLTLNGNISNRTPNVGMESFNNNLSILGSINVKVLDCTITEGMTDGVFVSKNESGVKSEKVLIKNCDINKNRRNNISLVEQDGVIVDNNTIDSAGIISGVNPMSGIDVEPNNADTSFNILIINNRITNNTGQYAVSVGAKGTENVKIERNVFDGNSQYGLNINSSVGFNNRNVVVEDNIFKNQTSQAALRIVGKNCELIKDNIFKNNLYGIQAYDLDDIEIGNNKFSDNLRGGIANNTFKNVKIISNIFIDNTSQQADIDGVGFCVKSTITDNTSIIVFNDNLVYSSPTATYLQKGHDLDSQCNSMAVGNLFKNLYDNIQTLTNFSYRYANFSVDASSVYQNIVGDMNFTGGGGDLLIGDKKHTYGTAIPATGSWTKGDIVYNTTPSSNGYIGWVCITGGTPGTWKGFGQIQT